MILDAWGWCTGTTQRDGMGREEGSGWGTRVYLWQIHVDIWQNQYNIVNLKNFKKTEAELMLEIANTVNKIIIITLFHMFKELSREVENI